jgi:hypothetical protein
LNSLSLLISKIELLVKGFAIDVPIWIDKTNIDLKICMYDRLYQEVIRVHNRFIHFFKTFISFKLKIFLRASAALRITFDIPDALKNHMEILPKTAFIQARAEFSAQPKILNQDFLHNSW